MSDEQIDAIDDALKKQDTKIKALTARVDSMLDGVVKLTKERDGLLLQVRELQNRVEMLTASLESILKRELGLDFQTYLDSKAAMPLTRVLLDEVIAKLTDKTEKRSCTCAETKLYAGESAKCPWCVSMEKRNCECAKATCPQCGPSGDDEGRIIPGQQITVNVNGKECEVGNTLTYEEILKLARQSDGATVLCKPEDRRLAGFSVIKGQTVEVSDGMVIVCIMTGNA